MFSSLTRAFVPRKRPQLSHTVRWASSIADICQQKIQDALQADSVKVEALHDDPNGSHINIQVVSDKFVSKRPVQRQQLVYKAIWEELQSNQVHAVDSMVCLTLEEADSK